MNHIEMKSHTVKFLVQLIDTVIPSGSALIVFFSSAESFVKLLIGIVALGYMLRQWHFFEKEKRELKNKNSNQIKP